MHREGLSDARLGGRPGRARRGRGAQEAVQKVHAERRQVCSGGRRALSECFWGGSEASPGRFRSGPGGPRRIQKNVVQVAPSRRMGPAFCHALYRRRFLMPRGGPPGGLAGAPKDFQKNVV